MAIMKTDLPGVKLRGRGKVRDIYDVGENLLIIATDRLSAFDVVLPTPIPNKGKVLTQMSEFWFDYFKDSMPNHVVSTEVSDYPKSLHEFRDQLTGRSMLVKKAKVFPIECVARGFLTGSGLKDYNKTGQVCGIQLPAGLRESDRLPQPIFTPATKVETGHDENISEEQAANIIGKENVQRLKELTLSICSRAVDRQSEFLQSLNIFFPNDVRRLFFGNVLVMARLHLCSRSKDRLRQPVGFTQAGR